MYVNSIMDDNINKDDFNKFIETLKKYKLDVEKVNYDKDEEYVGELNKVAFDDVPDKSYQVLPLVGYDD